MEPIIHASVMVRVPRSGSHPDVNSTDGGAISLLLIADIDRLRGGVMLVRPQKSSKLGSIPTGALTGLGTH
jgi:hypothetical protein